MQTCQAERPQAKLEAIQDDEAVGRVQFTSLLWVPLKVTRAFPQPQLPDLPYVNWGRKKRRRREEG